MPDVLAAQVRASLRGAQLPWRGPSQLEKEQEFRDAVWVTGQ